MSTNATTALDPGRLHETRAPQLVTAIVICPTISALLVGMRIYTRVVLTRKYFLEDYSIAAASVRRPFSSTPVLRVLATP